MRRREFVGLVSGAAAYWPLATRAQQAAMPVIGSLHTGTADAFIESALTAFRQGLKETGYVEGQNVTVEYRFAENKGDRLPALAADLVNRQVRLIFELAGGPSAALATKAATSTIPIVVAFGADPVKLGLAASLNRPGGNFTGVTFYTSELVSKRVELICDLLPQAKSIAYLRTGPKLSSAVTEQSEAETLKTAHDLGRQLFVFKVDNAQELNEVFLAVIKDHPDALIIASNPFFDNVETNDQLAALTLKNRLPAIYQQRAFPAAGGLMSYGANLGEAFRAAGVYAGRILKGEKPADLPFQQSTKVELVINQKTAKLLGLTIPLPLIGRADETIE